MAVGFGLLAALLWGLTDFMISISGRSFGVHRAMLYAQSVGVVLVGLCMLAPFARIPDPGSAVGWAAAIASAPIGVAATLVLYHGLKVGQVSVVAPITATFGAVTAVLSLATGERLAALALGGVALVVLGSALLSAQRRTGEDKRELGVKWALIASLAYGVQFWLQGRFAIPHLGGVLPVWIYYLVSTTLLLIAVPIRRQSLAIPIKGAMWVTGTGVIAVSGFLAVAIGLTTGQIAIVTVLASLQSGVTVLLACAHHRERLGLHQWAGLAMTLIGLAGVHLG